jgi:hypothetical protein
LVETGGSHGGPQKPQHIGFILGVVTATVVLVGIFVVQGHMTGRYVLDQPVAPSGFNPGENDALLPHPTAIARGLGR